MREISTAESPVKEGLAGSLTEPLAGLTRLSLDFDDCSRMSGDSAPTRLGLRGGSLGGTRFATVTIRAFEMTCAVGR